MTLFRTWFDTSGTELDERVLVTVGVTATAEKWASFDRDWLEVLGEAGINHYHTVELAAWKGEFASWKGDVKRRQRFVNRLLKVIKKHVNKTAVRTLILPDYQNVDQQYALTEYVGGPYAYSQFATMMAVLSWLHERKKEPKAQGWQCLIAKGDRGQPKLRKFLEKQIGDQEVAIEFLERIDKSTAEDWTPFSAADLIAHEYRRAYHEGFPMRAIAIKEMWRSALRSLKAQLPIDGGVLDQRVFQETCETLGVKRRT